MTMKTKAQVLNDAREGQGTGAYTLSTIRDFITASMPDVPAVYVQQFSAAGNGSTDDTSAINDAITAVAAGTEIIFPPGTYKISSTITINKALSINLQPGATVILANSTNHHMFVLTADNIKMYGGGKLDLNGANNQGGANDFECIQINGASHCRISNLSVTNFFYAGIALLGASTYNLIENCYITSAIDGTGIFMNYGSTAPSYNIVQNNVITTIEDGIFIGGNGSSPPTILAIGNVIQGNQITSQRIGVEVWGGAHYSVITGNHILGDVTGGWGWGVSVSNSDHTSVTGNTISAFSFVGIELAGSDFCTASGNTIYGNNSANGITVGTTGVGCAITGNTIDACVKGIYVNADHMVINGNSITNCTGNGIELNSNDHFVVSGNQIITSGTAIIGEEVSYVTITGNLINAGANGIQFTATGGPTRDYLTISDNVIEAVTNILTFTGANFGTNVKYDKLPGSGLFQITSSFLSLNANGTHGGTTASGTGFNDSGLWGGGVVRIDTGQSGNAGTFLNFVNDNTVRAQVGVLSHTATPYHGSTPDCLLLYHPTQDIVLDTDGSGKVISLSTATDVRLQITDNAIVAKVPSADQAVSVQIPTTGFSITVGNTQSALILTPAGTLATGTITMPAAPTDKQVMRVTSSQIITGLTVSPNSGQSILNAPTTLAAGGKFSYVYNLATTTWCVY